MSTRLEEAIKADLPNAHDLVEYIENHVPKGGFLRNLLSNNLRETYSCADHYNARCVRAYVQFLYNHAPAICWGSPEAYNAWVKVHKNVGDTP